MPSYHYTGADEAPAKRDWTVPSGIYEATILEATEKISKSSGNAMIEIKWELEGETPAHIFDYLTFTEKTAYRIDQFLAATGHAPEVPGDVTLNAADMHGWSAVVKVVLEPDTRDATKMRNKIVKYLVQEGKKQTPITPATAAKIDVTAEDNTPF